MKINLVPRRIDFTPAVQSFTEDKIAALGSLGSEVVSAEVVLSQDDGVNPAKRFRVGVRLALPGKDVYASETGADLHAVIDGVQSKLAQRLRKRKSRFENGRRELQRATERLRKWGNAALGETESTPA